MWDEETTLDPDLDWGEGMAGRVDGPVWTRPAGLGGRALSAGGALAFSIKKWDSTPFRQTFRPDK